MAYGGSVGQLASNEIALGAQERAAAERRLQMLLQQQEIQKRDEDNAWRRSTFEQDRADRRRQMDVNADFQRQNFDFQRQAYRDSRDDADRQLKYNYDALDVTRQNQSVIDSNRKAAIFDGVANDINRGLINDLPTLEAASNGRFAEPELANLRKLLGAAQARKLADIQAGAQATAETLNSQLQAATAPTEATINAAALKQPSWRPGWLGGETEESIAGGVKTAVSARDSAIKDFINNTYNKNRSYAAQVTPEIVGTNNVVTPGNQTNQVYQWSFVPRRTAPDSMDAIQYIRPPQTNAAPTNAVAAAPQTNAPVSVTNAPAPQPFSFTNVPATVAAPAPAPAAPTYQSVLPATAPALGNYERRKTFLANSARQGQINKAEYIREMQRLDREFGVQ